MSFPPAKLTKSRSIRQPRSSPPHALRACCQASIRGDGPLTPARFEKQAKTASTARQDCWRNSESPQGKLSIVLRQTNVERHGFEPTKGEGCLRFPYRTPLSTQSSHRPACLGQRTPNRYAAASIRSITSWRECTPSLRYTIAVCA